MSVEAAGTGTVDASSKILITAATGNVGSGVVRELRERGAEVRGFVRDPEKARSMLGEDVELAVGDFSDLDSVRAALEGVDRVFLACANVPGQVELESGVIDAAAEAGIERIVKLSAVGAEPGSPLLFWDWQGQIEEHLSESGVPAIILRPTNYMTNLLASAEAVAQTGKLFAPAADARIAMVDPRDVSAVAAAVLSDDGAHVGHTEIVTGPEALTYAEVAAALSEATGREIEYVSVPDEAAREGMLGSGMPEFVVDFLIGLFGKQREGAHAEATGHVRKITGREPRSVSDFAREYAGAFGAAG